MQLGKTKEVFLERQGPLSLATPMGDRSNIKSYNKTDLSPFDMPKSSYGINNNILKGSTKYYAAA